MKFLIILSFIFLISYASATDINSCQTISSSGIYNLTININSTNAQCIIVNSDDVILNGNNHNINFDNSITDANNAGSAIEINGTRNNVTINNFNITSYNQSTSGYYSGILVGVYNTVFPNQYNVTAITIKNNVFDINGSNNAITFDGYGYAFSTKIINNTINLHDGGTKPNAAISFLSTGAGMVSQDGLFENNNIHYDANYGLQIYCTTQAVCSINNTINGNNISRMTEPDIASIFFQYSTNDTISNNFINTISYGIYEGATTDGDRILNNFINSSTYGLVATNNYQNTQIENNTIYAGEDVNTGVAIIANLGLVSTNNIISGNNITAPLEGIEIYSSGSIYADNIIYAGNGAGINMGQSSGDLISGNWINASNYAISIGVNDGTNISNNFLTSFVNNGNGVGIAYNTIGTGTNMIDNNTFVGNGGADIYFISTAGTPTAIMKDEDIAKYSVTVGSDPFKFIFIRTGEGEIKFINGASTMQGTHLFGERGSGADVQIGYNYTFIDTISQPWLGLLANVTFYNLPLLANATILKDGALCIDCINFTEITGGNVTIQVPSWSSYEINGTEINAPLPPEPTPNNCDILTRTSYSLVMIFASLILVLFSSYFAWTAFRDGNLTVGWLIVYFISIMVSLAMWVGAAQNLAGCL